MFRQSNKKILRETSNKRSTDIIDKNSPFAFVEAYKSLRTNLSFITFGGEKKTLLVTSAIPNEGKSSVSINLARTLSLAGNKVLLIDGDLRSPSIHRYLRIKKGVSTGFSTVLSGQSTTEESIYKVPHLDIHVMLAGPIPPNASELYSRRYVSDVFDKLSKIYDYIIIDTPPVGIVTDAVTLSRYVDGIIFTIRHNYSDKSIVNHALRNLESSKNKILGIVMNDYKPSRDSSGNYYGYNYEYQSKPND